MAIKYIPFVRRPYPGIIVPTPTPDTIPVDILSSITLPVSFTGPIDISGSIIESRTYDGIGNAINSVAGALNVNIASGVALTAELDFATDSVTVYGSQGVPLQQKAVTDDLIVTLDGEIVTVQATNLDIRNLTFAQDKVDVSGSTIAATIAANVTVDQGTSPWIVAATNLDIRDLVFAQDKVDVSGSTISSTISGNVTVDQGTSPWVVSLTSTTITGTVAVTQSTSPWIVGATNLDIRDLVFATDKVDVSGSSVSVTIPGTITVDQGTSPWVVSATDLDIRDLVFATDKVDVSGSSIAVSAVTKVPLTAASPTFATVAGASGSVVAANANRKGLILVNTSANYISLGFGAAAVLYSGITLAPYGVFNMAEYDLSTAQIFAIGSAVASNLAIQEFS